jgi:Tfp pilus assembly protein PilO
MPDRDLTDPDGAWHLDKRVNVSHIVATLALALSAFAWGSAIDRRVAVIETQISQAKEDNVRQDQNSAEALRMMRDEMRELRNEVRALRQDLQAGVKR